MNTMKQKTNEHKTLVRLGVFALLAIMGLTFMFETSQEINAKVSLIELDRARIVYKTDFNPCAETKCTLGATAKYIGQDPSLSKDEYEGGAGMCQCPDGKIIKIRPRMVKRF